MWSALEAAYDGDDVHRDRANRALNKDADLFQRLRDDNAGGDPDPTMV